MSNIEIKEVKTNRDLRRFVDFPYTIYKDHPYWIPPIRMDELNTLKFKNNPNHKTNEVIMLMAIKDNKIAGRIVGIINHKYIEKWGNKYARFGWLDFIDDEEVVKALFIHVENWAKSKGMIAVNGPMGFTDLDKEGLLIEGFEELGTMPMIYNYPYYPKHLEALGYKKDADWLEFQIYPPKEIPEKVLRVQDMVLKRANLHVLNYKKAKELMPYGKQIFILLNEAYGHLYGTVEFTEQQIEAYIKQYISYCDPRWTILILDAKNELAGFCIAMPSFSKALQKNRGRLFPFGFLHMLSAMKKNNGLDLYLVAVKAQYKGLGLPSILMSDMIKNAIKYGVEYAESAGELESNIEVQSMWKSFKHRQHKKRRVYLKLL